MYSRMYEVRLATNKPSRVDSSGIIHAAQLQVRRFLAAVIQFQAGWGVFNEIYSDTDLDRIIVL